MRTAAIGLLCLIICGCTSTIKLSPGCMSSDVNNFTKEQIQGTGTAKSTAPCVVEAEDYIVTLRYDEKKQIYTWAMRPKKWYESSVNSALHGLGDLIPLIGGQ